MPADAAVTTPEVRPMVATARVPLVHVPPVVALLNVVVLQKEVTPVIGVSGLTVTVTEAIQPITVVYCMVVTPFEMPVTIPDVAPIVATVVLLLVHVPPGVASVNAVVNPWHTVVTPVIGAKGYTVTVVTAVQPSDVVYTIVAVPPDIPRAVPLLTPIVATAGLPLLHVPPVVPLLSVDVLPWQRLVVPVMALIGLTVIIDVAVQPAGVMYFINADPLEIPDTIPADDIVAIVVAPLLHVPPGVASLNVIVKPWQTDVGPVMGASGLTVAVVVV